MTLKASNLDRENKLWLFMNKEDEREYFNEICDRIIRDPRFYLDNLERLDTFVVSFIHYGKSRKKEN